MAASPPRAKGPSYAYNLDYAGPDGIIPPQHHVVSVASLATVHERYYQDRASTGGWGVFGGFPAQLQGILFTPILPLPLPERQTQYLTAGPSIAWQVFYIEFLNSFSGGQSDTFRTLPAGRQLTDDWNRYPLHPQPDVQPLRGALGRLLPGYPSAFRAGNELLLHFNAFSDNQPGHFGSGLFAGAGTRVTSRYAVFQNGTEIAHGNPALGIPPVRLSAQPSVLKLVLTADRSSPFFQLSPASTTVWTWRSIRQPRATVPPNWYCGFAFTRGQVKVIRTCAVQPALTLRYRVHRLALDGSAPPGQQVISLTVGRLQLAKAARITGASAKVSYDDGQLWQPARVTAAGGGHFRISFRAPPGVDVTLRISAADAAGGKITETIVRGYGVGL